MPDPLTYNLTEAERELCDAGGLDDSSIVESLRCAIINLDSVIVMAPAVRTHLMLSRAQICWALRKAEETTKGKQANA